MSPFLSSLVPSPPHQVASSWLPFRDTSGGVIGFASPGYRSNKEFCLRPIEVIRRFSLFSVTFSYTISQPQ